MPAFRKGCEHHGRRQAGQSATQPLSKAKALQALPGTRLELNPPVSSSRFTAQRQRRQPSAGLGRDSRSRPQNFQTSNYKYKVGNHNAPKFEILTSNSNKAGKLKFQHFKCRKQADRYYSHSRKAYNPKAREQGVPPRRGRASTTPQKRHKTPPKPAAERAKQTQDRQSQKTGGAEGAKRKERNTQRETQEAFMLCNAKLTSNSESLGLNAGIGT